MLSYYFGNVALGRLAGTKRNEDLHRFRDGDLKLFFGKETFTKETKLAKMKVAIILGTRPEIIKMSPVIRACEKQGLDYFILHTGQHYSYNMDKLFFEQLELPEAKYNLDVGSGSHAEQTAKMLTGIEKILMKEKIGIVLVEGDTNTVFAGALTASKLHVKVGHVEAGLRSYDRNMHEEINRVLTDHCSDYLSFLQLESKARLVLTDSGGMQEEACILNVPCVTLRDNTERPETLEAGSNVLAGTNAESILGETKEMLNRNNNWNNPFGDGKAGERIVEVIMEKSQ